MMARSACSNQRSDRLKRTACPGAGLHADEAGRNICQAFRQCGARQSFTQNDCRRFELTTAAARMR
jgi:hypothetical protein